MSDGAKDSQETRSGRGMLSRIGGLFKGGRHHRRVPNTDDPDLVIVAWCNDDAEASSAVLESAGYESTDPAVLRHLFAVPEGAVGEVTEGAALSGYEETDRIDSDPEAPADRVGLALAKVMTIDARTLSQERSRMASLASRAGGTTVGWAILVAPDEERADTADR